MPDPAVELARSQIALYPSGSSASGYRRVIDVPPNVSKPKKRLFGSSTSQLPVEQVAYPHNEYPGLVGDVSEVQGLGGASSDPLYGLGPHMAGYGYEYGDGHLSWNERRKLKKYVRQCEKDRERQLKEERRQAVKLEKEQRRWLEHEERKRIK